MFKRVLIILIVNLMMVFCIGDKGRLDDYEYLWKTLRSSYPFLGVARRSGVDVEGIYEEFKGKIKESSTDEEFFYDVKECLKNFHMIGHLNAVSANYYNGVKDLYKGNPIRKTWNDAIFNPKTEKFYDKQVKSDLKISKASYDKPSNVITKIILEDKIAYMKISSFNYESLEEDSKVIFDFYKEVSNYENLIIDITDNGGGSDYAWMYYIVAPNISEVLSSEYYILFNESENNIPYLNDAGISSIACSIDKLPEFPNLNKEDIDDLNYFYRSEFNVFPNENEYIFKGKIWTLINENCYSASDKYANFCKATGFSQLVGNTTAGDGIGIDPEFIVLPNSGMLVRYSMEYGLNPDGSNNEEFGTTPHIISKEGESPLETCLSFILGNDYTQPK